MATVGGMEIDCIFFVGFFGVLTAGQGCTEITFQFTYAVTNLASAAPSGSFAPSSEPSNSAGPSLSVAPSPEPSSSAAPTTLSSKKSGKGKSKDNATVGTMPGGGIENGMVTTTPTGAIEVMTIQEQLEVNRELEDRSCFDTGLSRQAVNCFGEVKRVEFPSGGLVVPPGVTTEVKGSVLTINTCDCPDGSFDQFLLALSTGVVGGTGTSTGSSSSSSCSDVSFQFGCVSIDPPEPTASSTPSVEPSMAPSLEPSTSFAPTMKGKGKKGGGKGKNGP